MSIPSPRIPRLAGEDGETTMKESGYQKRLREIKQLKQEVQNLKAKLITNPRIAIEHNIMDNKLYAGIMFTGNMTPPSFFRMEGNGDTVEEALSNLRRTNSLSI